MKAALVGAVDFNAEDFAARTFDLVIAVDAGWLSCKDAGVMPDCALGDFDSLAFVPHDCELVQFSPVKDESDMELACKYAYEHGADELFLYGAFSQRIDHTLANIGILAQFAQMGCKMTGIGKDFAICALAGGTPHACLEFEAFDQGALQGLYAPCLSLFAIGSDAQTLCIEGMAYSANELSLPAATSLGLSNEFIGKAARISLGEGVVIAIFSLGALEHAHWCQ